MAQPQGICDKSGFKANLRSLRRQWDGQRVLPELWERKYPLFSTTVKIDKISLSNPRPPKTIDIINPITIDDIT